MPRRVRVSRKIWQKGPPLNPNKPNVVLQGKWILQEYFAIFHDFAIDTDNSQGHHEVYPVAILELEDGSIQVVHAEHVTFCTPTLPTQCE